MKTLSVAAVNSKIETDLGHGIEQLVKVDQNLALCYLCDIVHAFACKVAHFRVWISEASQNRRDNERQVSWYVGESEGNTARILYISSRQ